MGRRERRGRRNVASLGGVRAEAPPLPSSCSRRRVGRGTGAGRQAARSDVASRRRRPAAGSEAVPAGPPSRPLVASLAASPAQAAPSLPPSPPSRPQKRRPWRPVGLGGGSPREPDPRHLILCANAVQLALKSLLLERVVEGSASTSIARAGAAGRRPTGNAEHET